ncbi:BTAD domain-containing putative transcriptional regulator [Amycolatopsis suaedae]|uniref:FHA domain-containing protein n=1 Tax=Amycolatopsis suaedae TaxID=2510978 RepID=A0A4Q7JBJ7_9PSEU|nr:BTAD domain-containing putative transcriptional regulator [Amycolatopsis suaedae]RZQ64396.1 FHA domain-containing protein [Amycolatopsis suaedae]
MADDNGPVTFRLFGGITAHAGERPVDMGSTRERCLLAALLLNNGVRVPRHELTGWIWDAEPKNPGGELDTFMSRLRKRLVELGLDGALVNENGLCRLEVAAESVDVHRFRALVSRAREADDAQAAALLADALAVSRGIPLAGVDNRRIDAVRHGLTEERYSAEITFLRTELRLGRHQERVADVTRLFTERPDDATAATLAMHALHLAGRRGDALDVYREHDERRSRSGLVPDRSVEDLRDRILRDDETLQVDVPVPRKADPAVTPVSRTELDRTRDVPVPAEASAVLDEHAVVVLVGPWTDCRDAALRLLRDRSLHNGRTLGEVLKNWARPVVARLPVPPDGCGYLLTLNDFETDRAGTAFAEDLIVHAARLAERRSWLVVTARPELWQDCRQVAGHLTVHLSAGGPERERLVLTGPDGGRSAFPLQGRGSGVTLGRSADDYPDPDIVLDTGVPSPVSRRHALLTRDHEGWWIEPTGKNLPSIRRRGETEAECLDRRVRLRDGDVVLVDLNGHQRQWRLEFRDPQATTTSRGDEQ